MRNRLFFPPLRPKTGVLLKKLKYKSAGIATASAIYSLLDFIWKEKHGGVAQIMIYCF